MHCQYRAVGLLLRTAQVAHQNPVPSSSEDFDISRGADLLAFGKHTYIGGAVSVLCARPDVDIVPVYAAGGPSAGVLEHESFLEMSGELLDGIRAAQVEGAIDAVYFSMHGAMATSEEHDPEGYLLECVRVSATTSQTHAFDAIPGFARCLAWPNHSLKKPCIVHRRSSAQTFQSQSVSTFTAS